MLTTEGSDFNKIITEKYCTVWEHPAILLHNTIDHLEAASGRVNGVVSNGPR
jgi:hypothetical protein